MDTVKVNFQLKPVAPDVEFRFHPTPTKLATVIAFYNSCNSRQEQVELAATMLQQTLNFIQVAAPRVDMEAMCKEAISRTKTWLEENDGTT